MTSPVYTFKKLNYLYNIHDKYTAGIILEGWEVKALSTHNGDINTGFCSIINNQLCLVNAKITPEHNHILDDIASNKESRSRGLLLNKQEIKRIKEKLYIKGYTCVPSKLYRDTNHLWKLDIVLVTGKKLYDKREALKTKSIERENQREN